MYKIALVGCGRISAKHIEAIEKLKNESLAEIIACCDPKKERAEEAAQKTNSIAYTNYKTMLSEIRRDCDLVSICTHAGLHTSQAIEAAEAGVNILSEKPQGCTLKSCDAAIKAADEAGIHYLVIKQNRFNPTIKLLRRAFEAERFGRVYMILANVLWTRPQSYYSAEKWRGTYEFDGGCLSNQSSHYVDLVQWFGGSVENVIAESSTQKIRMEAEDTISVVIKFRNGSIGNINATILTYPKNLEGSLTILGDRGTVRVGGIALNKIAHWEFDSKHEMDDELQTVDTQHDSVYGSGHLPYYRHTLNVLSGKEEAVCTAREARKTVELIQMAYKR
ncbi:MAG: Gfo/Idh/MocA family oxidoreductase [Oscillospiraceae bacterium]|nr:Gfo/Idh/MocA family oxidoreductase [Oscillospiraceae bacterium]